MQCRLGAAFAERMKVGASVAQFIGHDPRLPPGVWGRKRGMQEMVSAYLSFEERIAPKAQMFLEQSITANNRAAQAQGERHER